MAQLGSNTSGHLFDTSFTTEGILFSASSGVITSTAAGSAGQVMQSAGNASPPAYSTATYPSTAGTSGNVLTSNGTNFTSAAPAAPSLVGFIAYVSTSQVDIVGGGTSTYNIIFDSTVRNDGTAYNTSTGVFTAPSTGVYLFNSNVAVQGIDATATATQIEMYGSVFNQFTSSIGNGAVNAFGNWFISQSWTVPMITGATVGVQIFSNQATKTVDIGGGAYPTNICSTFTGFRLGT